MSQNLIRRAEANTPARSAALRSECANDPAGHVSRFADAMAHTLAATTINDDKVTHFTRAGQILSKRGLLAAASGGDASAVEATFRAEDPDYYSGRVAFEDHWEHGRAFIYFALVIDGLGYARFGDYGNYTLVLDGLMTHKASALGAFPKNTAKYLDAWGRLDVAKCEADATAWADRAALMTVQHAAEVRFGRAPWEELVCRSDDESTEVVRDGPLALELVRQVRVRSDLKTAMIAARTKSRGTEPLSQLEQVQAVTWENLQAWRRRFGVVIVVCDAGGVDCLQPGGRRGSDPSGRRLVAGARHG